MGFESFNKSLKLIIRSKGRIFDQNSLSRPWVIFLVFILALNLLLAACSDTPTATPTPNPVQEAAKVDTVLRDLLDNYLTGGLEAARQYARNTGLLDDQDRIRFGLTLTSASAAPTITDQIKKMGGEVYSSSDDQLAVVVSLTRLTGYVNSADKRNFFQELAAFKEVKELKFLVRPPTQIKDQNLVKGQRSKVKGLGFDQKLDGSDSLQSQTPSTFDSQTSPNEAIGLIGADRWQKAGYTGRGIQVGIIDGGFANYRSFLGTALPPASQVQFKSFLLGEGEGSEAHGVAVAEIVHSLAPDATLILTPIEDEIGFTQAVQYFIDRKVQIIQISLGWGGIFPGDGTGKMDEKLDEARRAGILPIVSAGNYGQAHYTGLFNPDQNGFDRFSADRTTLKLTAEDNSAWVALRWDEPWDAPLTNLDLYILDSKNQRLVSSRNEQGPGKVKPPTELAPFSPTPGQTYYIQVKMAGTAAPSNLRFHLFAYHATLENATPESSLATPSDARGVLSIGATYWKDDSVEPYSSRGPTSDGRAKPELMAPSRVSNLVFKQPFAGTSAAAPQVSGTAALLWSAARDLNADQVATYLTRNALPLGQPGRSPETGFGRLRLGPEEVAKGGVADLLGAVANGPPFQDDFHNAASGLPNNSLGYYAPNGQPPGYYVPGPGGQLNWNTYLNRSFEEFRAEVSVTPGNSGPNMFYGLVFWQQAADDYYAWLVAGNRYALFKRTGPNWIILADWNQDAALRTGPDGNLRLSLEATAAYLRLRVGNTTLQSITLSSGSKTAPPVRLGGRFGLAAGQLTLARPVSNTNLPAVRFSNLVITPLSTR
jgi:subtilisin family serine protease